MSVNILFTFFILDFCLCKGSDISLFPNLPIAPLTSKNELCQSDSVAYLKNLDNLTLWSYQMWEASAKSTTGSLRGNRYQMGDWDECMKVKAPFKTQYCLVVVKANINGLEPHQDPYALDRNPQGSVLNGIFGSDDISKIPRDTISIGWCVPASCAIDDLENVVNDHFNQSKILLMEHNVTYSGIIIEKLCQKQDEAKSFDVMDVVFCIVVAIFLSVVIIVTVYEMKIEDLSENEKADCKKRIGCRILIGFSVRKNFIDLAKVDDLNPALSSLNGLKIVSIFFIVLAHGGIVATTGPILNIDDAEKEFRSAANSFVFRADLFVDTFFVISGILATYGLLTQFQKKQIHPLFIIFLRYIRLTPVYAFVIFFYGTIFNYIGTGPLWKASAGAESDFCKNSWWVNLLYLNNYVNANQICVIQSWYLACDFHYFVIATFITLIFSKNEKFGGALFILFFILSVAVPFAIIVIYKEPALMLFYLNALSQIRDHSYFILRYIPSHMRAAPYCIGMMGGYVYYRLKGCEKKISKLTSHSIALVSILLLLIIMESGAIFYNPYHKYNTLEAGIYASLNRLTWAVGIMGLLLTTSFGHSTVIQQILSWSPFVPFSKLTYSVYLLHIIFQYRRLGMTWSPQRYNMFTVFALIVSDCVLALIAGLVMYLLIETPIRKLFKELLISSRHVASPSEPIQMQDSATNNNNMQMENNSRF